VNVVGCGTSQRDLAEVDYLAASWDTPPS